MIDDANALQAQLNALRALVPQVLARIEAQDALIAQLQSQPTVDPAALQIIQNAAVDLANQIAALSAALPHA